MAVIWKERAQRQLSSKKYHELKMQNYLLPNQMVIKQCKLLFSLRAQMTSVRCNFKNSYDDLTCPVCENQTYQDTQSHILQCKILIENENILAGNQILYSDLFSQDVSKLSVVTFLLEKLLEKRKRLLWWNMPQEWPKWSGECCIFWDLRCD